jgi:protein CpxP
MKKYQRVLLAIGATVLLVVTMVAVANAQNAKRNLQGRRQQAANAMFRAKAFLQGLNLTQEQKDQVKTILTSHKEEIKAVVRDTAKARMALGSALSHGASEQVLKAAYDEVSRLGWNAVTLRSKIGAEMKQILTPEQLEFFLQRLQKVDSRIQNLLGRIDKKIADQ